jgi:hypothetical protein
MGPLSTTYYEIKFKKKHRKKADFIFKIGERGGEKGMHFNQYFEFRKYFFLKKRTARYLKAHFIKYFIVDTFVQKGNLKREWFTSVADRQRRLPEMTSVPGGAWKSAVVVHQLGK